jgi:hypothetical protein
MREPRFFGPIRRYAFFIGRRDQVTIHLHDESDATRVGAVSSIL